MSIQHGIEIYPRRLAETARNMKLAVVHQSIFVLHAVIELKQLAHSRQTTLQYKIASTGIRKWLS
uniref:Uncharacterized protein n=1 Tax=Peronospora matthiolae TaxID=2874970 RepID=A0AAV1T0D0_9STRA